MQWESPSVVEHKDSPGDPKPLEHRGGTDTQDSGNKHEHRLGAPGPARSRRPFDRALPANRPFNWNSLPAPGLEDVGRRSGPRPEKLGARLANTGGYMLSSAHRLNGAAGRPTELEIGRGSPKSGRKSGAKAV